MARSRHQRKNRNKSRNRNVRRLANNLEAGEHKMSEVLLEFIEPYRKFAQDDAALKRLVALGIVAWNIALLPETEQSAAIGSLARAGLRDHRPSLVTRMGNAIRRLFQRQTGDGEQEDDRGAHEIEGVIAALVLRKLNRYADNGRFIVNYQLDTSGEDLHLVVMSTLEPIRRKGS